MSRKNDKLYTTACNLAVVAGLKGFMVYLERHPVFEYLRPHYGCAMQPTDAIIGYINEEDRHFAQQLGWNRPIVHARDIIHIVKFGRDWLSLYTREREPYILARAYAAVRGDA